MDSLSHRPSTHPYLGPENRDRAGPLAAYDEALDEALEAEAELVLVVDAAVAVAST